jgi:hypothetical protein
VKLIQNMSEAEVMNMTEAEAKAAVSQQMKPYRDGLAKMMKFLEPNLMKDRDIHPDTCIAINFATNVEVGFTKTDLAGYLAAAQYELAMLRIATKEG